MNTPAQDEDRYLDLLPWYLNGTLDDADRDWVTAYLRDRPHAVESLQAHRRLQQAVVQYPGQVPADAGWEAYAARVGLDPAAASPPAPSRRVGWLGQRAAALGVGALVLGQALAIVVLWPARAPGSPGAVALRSVAPVAVGPLLRVRFRDDAPERDLRGLLLTVDGRIVGGPSQLGDYDVSVPSGRLAAARKTLAASPIVQAVSVP